MALLETLMLNVAPSLAKVILRMWLKDSSIDIDSATDLVDALKNLTTDVSARQHAKRQFEEIGEKAAESLLPVFEAEQGRLDEGSAETVAFLVGETLKKVRIDPQLLAEQDLEPMKLAQYVLNFDTKVPLHLSRIETELYCRTISEASQRIVDIASHLPTFYERTAAEILKRENQLLTIAKETLEEVRRIREESQLMNPQAEAARFETAYRLAVSRNLDRIELFGVDVSNASRRHPLSIAYIYCVRCCAPCIETDVNNFLQIGSSYTKHAVICSWNDGI